MKIKPNNPILLTVCVCVLALLCFLSIDSPMRFQRQKARREVAVRQRMQRIMDAEKRYLKRHGEYAGSFEALKRDGLLADSLTYIPFSDDEHFTLHTTIVGKGGRGKPQIECSALYSQYLDGLDKASVSNLIGQANEQGMFPGIKSLMQ